MTERKDDHIVGMLADIMNDRAPEPTLPTTPAATANATNDATANDAPPRQPVLATLDTRANVVDLVTISAWAMGEYSKLLRRLGTAEVHNMARVLDDGALLLSCSAPTGHFVLRLDANEWRWRLPLA